MTTIDITDDKNSNKTGKIKKNMELKPFDAEDLKENDDSYINNITDINPFIINGNTTKSNDTNINNTESNIAPSPISKSEGENATQDVEENEDQGLFF